MKKELTNREKLILNYLNNNSFITANKLADHLSVTARTIKSDIVKLKEIINTDEEILVSTPGSGFKLNQQINSISNQQLQIGDKDLILNNYDRIASIIQELLISDGYIKYEVLADRLFISESTLKRDMRTVRKLLGQYQLKISFKPNYGAIVIGKEFDIRSAISFFFFDSFWKSISLKQQNIYNEESEEYQEIKKSLYGLINQYGVDASEKYIKNLVSKVIITFIRAKYERKLHIEESMIGDENIEFTMEVINEASAIFKEVKVGKASINYLYTFISSNLDIQYLPALSEKAVTSIVNKMLEEVYQNFDIDFSKNTVLIDNLRSFIEHCYKRTKNKTSVYNISSLRYFRDYLFATKITISAVYVFEKYVLKEEMPIHEYGELILLFQYALDSIHKKREKLVLFTGNDEAEKLLYLNRLKALIHSDRYTVEYAKKLSDIKKNDIVLSTVALDKGKKKFNVISEHLTKRNLKNTVSKIDTFDVEKKSEILNKYIHEDSILKISSSSKKTVQSLIKKYLYENNYLKENFSAPLIYTELGNSIVNIQDLHKIIKDPIVLFVFLEKPIVWNRTVVDTLFLIKTKKDGDSDLHYLCDVFSAFANNPSKIKESHSSKKSENIRSFIIESKLNEI